MYTFICYPRCTTCKKAQAWLDAHQIPYTFRDISQENPTRKELAAWHKLSGLPLKRFFNTSGIKYREMNLSARLPDMAEKEQIALLSTDGMLVKRPLLRVSGADLMDGTPIFDIKPYLQSDCVPDARDGFSSAHSQDYLPVEIPPQWLEKVPTDKQEALLGILREDPRPAYQEEGRRYGFFFAGLEIFFVVEQGVLQVVEIKNA